MKKVLAMLGFAAVCSVVAALIDVALGVEFAASVSSWARHAHNVFYFFSGALFAYIFMNWKP